MKKLIKNIAIAVIVLPLIIACAPLLNEPASGIGTFSLSIGGEGSARTILPAVQQRFDAYILTFTSGLATTTVPKTSATLSAPITLARGTWDLNVKAFRVAAGTQQLAAEEDIPGIVIGQTPVVRTIELKANPIVLGEGTGTFTWNVTLPSNVDFADMTIQTIVVEGNEYSSEETIE
jgi:hypothetical protein